MRHQFAMAALVVALGTATAAVVAGQAVPRQAAAPHSSLLPIPSDADPEPAAPELPEGPRVAAHAGQTSNPGSYSIHVEMPDGHRIAAHWHPVDERSDSDEEEMTMTIKTSAKAGKLTANHSETLQLTRRPHRK